MNSSQIKKSRVAFFCNAVLAGHAAGEIGSRPSVGLQKVRAMVPIRNHSDAAPIAETGKSSLVCGNHPGLLLHRAGLRRND